MLSVARERPLDPVTLDVLRRVDQIARELALDYFVVGATARDILLTGVFGLDTGRATRDPDLGVATDGWPHFEAIETRLVDTGAFVPDKTMAQRLYYRATSADKRYPLDLIPFGGVEQPDKTIAWPPDESVMMNVAGFGEALACAVPVEVDPGFVVHVASLPGLTILKLVAWVDRGAGNPRDAIDLATLLRQYGVINQDRLYDAEVRVLEVANHDLDLAGARLLGADASRIIEAATRSQILAVLSDPARLDLLVLDVARGLRSAEDPVGVAGGLLAQFKAGFDEVLPDSLPL